jgi:hypothetical protein
MNAKRRGRKTCPASTNPDERIEPVPDDEPQPFQLKDRSFNGGKGLQPGIRLDDWETIRDLAYGFRSEP